MKKPKLNPKNRQLNPKNTQRKTPKPPTAPPPPQKTLAALAKLVSSTGQSAHHHAKLWGWEDWLHNGPGYTFKILNFYSRTSGSLHYHLKKTETWFVDSGTFHITLVHPPSGDNYTFEASHGSVVHLPAGTPHQVRCIASGQIIEASTPHDESDTYRLFPSQAFTPPEPAN